MSVELKWQKLNEERDALKARVIELEELTSHEDLLRQRDELRRQVAELTEQFNLTPALIGLDDEEQQAMNALLFVMRRIVDDWKLRANSNELAAAVHVIQGFIIQHMLVRLSPQAWGSWWE